VVPGAWHDARMPRFRFEVTGRVQGVGFRAHARAEAARRHLVGFVQNLPDGSVAGEVAGDAAGLQEFAAWLRRGPLLARVDRLSWQPLADAGGESTFEVRR
jgi:acylphosphatase